MATRRESGLVVFLGAGASKPLGLPLTDEVFEEILRSLRAGELFGGDLYEQRRFRRILTKIFPGIDFSAQQSLISITSILSLVDHLLLTKQSPRPGLGGGELARLQLLLERATCEVINVADFTPAGKEYLSSVAEWLKRKAVERRLTIITTNYDISFEAELFDRSFDRIESMLRKKGQGRRPSDAVVSYHNHHRIARDFDFGFDWRYASNAKRVEVFSRPVESRRRYAWYKLHGSFNWLKCEVCSQIYINCDYSIVDVAFWEKSPNSTCHCGNFPLKPVIVAPSVTRDIRDSCLTEIWRHSFEALRQAKEWVFIGYSFPQEDIGIRSLLLRAFYANETPRGPTINVVVRSSETSADERPNKRKSDTFPPSASQLAEFHARVSPLFPSAKLRAIGAEGAMKTM